MERVLIPLILSTLLLLFFADPTIESSIIVGPGSVSAFEKSFVRFYCLASIDAGRQAKIVWLKDTREIADGNNVITGVNTANYTVSSNFQNQTVESELNITEVTRNHNGTYVCQVRVYVSAPHLVIESPSQYCSLRVFYLPTPVCPTQSSFVLNQEATILCYSDPGEKPANLQWLRNGHPVISRSFAALETIHTLNYSFSVTEDHQGKKFQCRTTSESFENTENTCEFGPIHVSLDMSLELVSTVGDHAKIECSSNGNNEIEYTFYQEGILVTDTVSGNSLEVNLGEKDINITCVAVDSDGISGSIDIILSPKESPDSTTTQPASSVITTIAPVPVSTKDDDDNILGIAIGTSCTAVIMIVCAVVIGYLILRRKKERTPKRQVNDDLFLEEAFGRRKSLNVSFRKVQKRQSKQANDETTITEVDEDNMVKFVSERNIESSNGKQVMPDVITSTDRINMAYQDQEENQLNDEPQNEHIEGSNRGNSYTHLERLSSETHSNQALNADKKILEHPENFETKEIWTKEQKSPQIEDVPINIDNISSRFDFLIKESNESKGSTEPIRPTSQYQSSGTETMAEPQMYNTVADKKITDKKESTLKRESDTPRQNELVRNTNQKRKKKNNSVMRPDGEDSKTAADGFDDVDTYDPPKEILPFINKGAKIFGSSNEPFEKTQNENHNTLGNTMPRRVVHSRPVDARPHVEPVKMNAHVSKMAAKGVINPTHKRTQQHDLDRRGENVVWNKGANYKGDLRVPTSSTVVRNQHPAARSHHNEAQVTKPRGHRSTNPRQPRPPGSQSLRDNYRHDNPSQQHRLPGRSTGSMSHVVRNAGARKGR